MSLFPITFFVPGLPKAKGSFSPVKNRHTGKLFLKPNNADSPHWQQLVSTYAMQYRQPALYEGPVALVCDFVFLRPKSAKKRVHHTVKPDVDKTTRLILDALTGVLFRDDAQVTTLTCTKAYGEEQGVRVTFEQMEPT